MNKGDFQDLSSFVLPKNFRGRPAWFVQVWWLVQLLLFRFSPQFAYPWRVFLLRLFGAKIGKDVLIRPTATFTYPWRVSIGNNSWVGDDVVFYSLSKITVGSNTVISQKSYICAGGHDYRLSDFPIFGNPVVIGDQVWVATDVYISPGVVIGDYSVIGARSSVFSDIPSGVVCFGSPCKVVKARERL